MRAASGRAVSARIVERLREALADGRSRTYPELARIAKCTTRSVRNYLDDEGAIGMRVTREAGGDRKIYVRAEQPDAGASMEELAQVVARQMLKNIFPIAGTSLEKTRRTSKAHVIVAVRGAYEYEESHLRILRAWLTWSAARPRRPVRFHYEGDRSGTRESWPLGVVIRDLARVYLLGVPADAFDARDVRTYALERTSALTVRDAAEGDAPKGLDAAAIEASMDIPFSVSNAHHGVNVHVRFSKATAKFIRNRRWHKNQRMRTRKDGTLDVRFGPTDLGEATAWIRQWGRGVEVVGDRELVRKLSGRRS